MKHDIEIAIEAYANSRIDIVQASTALEPYKTDARYGLEGALRDTAAQLLCTGSPQKIDQVLRLMELAWQFCGPRDCLENRFMPVHGEPFATDFLNAKLESCPDAFDEMSLALTLRWWPGCKDQVNSLRVNHMLAAGRPAPVAMPKLAIKSDFVERAIADAEKLREGGIDRMHVALHGYLQCVCDAAGVSYADQGITGLFKLLRAHHPEFTGLGPRAEDVEKVLKSLANVIDALNPIRNGASMAHPSPQLDKPEAMLIMNAARTILHYVDAKVSAR